MNAIEALDAAEHCLAETRRILDDLGESDGHHSVSFSMDQLDDLKKGITETLDDYVYPALQLDQDTNKPPYPSI